MRRNLFQKFFQKSQKTLKKFAPSAQNREMRLSASKKCALYGERVPQSNQVCSKTALTGLSGPKMLEISRFAILKLKLGTGKTLLPTI